MEELRLDTEELLLSPRSSEGPRPGASSPFSRTLDAAWIWGGRSVGAPCSPAPAPTALGPDGSLPALDPLRVLRPPGRSAYLGWAGLRPLLFPGWLLRLRARLLLADLCTPGAGGWGGAQAAEPAPLSPPCTLWRDWFAAP